MIVAKEHAQICSQTKIFPLSHSLRVSKMLRSPEQLVTLPCCNERIPSSAFRFGSQLPPSNRR
jgi:hypothetical protein